jgi:pSer/pThr/pTyr-binding forkhead associated (FHA) protein
LVPRDLGVLVVLLLQLADQGCADMELKLVVLAGAKEGTQIPLKKDKFIIGRASECTLRAGSSAISRRHCAIVRKDDAWLVRDLGSRNGTFLNESAVETPTPLKVGDEIRVGPLHFRVEQLVKAAEGSQAAKPSPTDKQAATAAKSNEPVDVSRGKQPPVKDVAEVVKRTVKQADASMSEDDISRWLLGVNSGGGDALRETQTLSMEETTAITHRVTAPESASTNGESTAETTDLPAEAATDNAAEEATEKSGGWSLFKKKGAAKKSPGKLPPRPAEVTKDSREAAMDILREMTRRR